jgi:hypothetical protein
VTDVVSRKTIEYSALTVLAAWAWLTPTLSVRAQEIDQIKAVKVKAAFLYNFAKFIEWPEDVFKHEDTPFLIGVLGDDPIADSLESTVAEKGINNRPVKMRRFYWSSKEDRAELRECQVLYVGESARNQLPEILELLNGHPVLLVSDILGFAGNGGMIGFVLEESRIAFEICRETVEHARLKASAKLLKLARIVPVEDRRISGTQSSESQP